jgi:hypothetical protein
MKGERFVDFVDNGQTNPAQLRLACQLAIFFPTVQRRQGIELTFDGPISANDQLGPTEQPNAHHALKGIHSLLAVRHIEARLQQVLANLFFGF